MNKQKKIIHLIPSDRIGGVECAAKSTQNISNESMVFTLKYIYSAMSQSKILDQINYIKSIYFSVKSILNESPDIIIASLWKSCFVVFIVSIVKPNIKIILFLHSQNLNPIDKIINNMLAFRANEIWADSKSTLEGRLNSFFLIKKPPTKVISFILSKITPLKYKSPSPNFIYWGRIHSIKCIDKSIDIFLSIYNKRKDSNFIIIGPDGGDLKRIQSYINSLNSSNSIRILPEKDLSEIIRIANSSSFYLQCSASEGLAMSVAESMQLGLIPVVTSVGEIRNYCIHRKNSIIINNNNFLISEILNIINNENYYKYLRKNAISTWNSANTYQEDIYESCSNIK